MPHRDRVHHQLKRDTSLLNQLNILRPYLLSVQTDFHLNGSHPSHNVFDVLKTLKTHVSKVLFSPMGDWLQPRQIPPMISLSKIEEVQADYLPHTNSST